MAAGALIDGYSMEGISELIGRWLDADPDRTQQELARLCQVAPRTAGRWAKDETTPSGEDLERLAKVLTEDLGIDLEGVHQAARESRRRGKTHQPRTGVSPLRVIDERYVLTADDKRRWRESVQMDATLSDDARAVLTRFTTYFGADGQLEVFVDPARMAEEWPTLTLELVESAWPEVVESPYVERLNFPAKWGWVFRLLFP